MNETKTDVIKLQSNLIKRYARKGVYRFKMQLQQQQQKKKEREREKGKNLISFVDTYMKVLQNTESKICAFRRGILFMPFICVHAEHKMR